MRARCNWIGLDVTTPFTIALVGNPNSGKTTLFNALTGSHAQVANWPGVTVMRKEGQWTREGMRCQIIDLPGTYSLTHLDRDAAIDSRITADFLQHTPPDVIINVLDAGHLERHLYLTMQCIEMGLPMIVVLNMVDEATQRGLQVDAACLSARLGCPVVAMVASKQQGMASLERTLLDLRERMPIPKPMPLPEPLHEACMEIQRQWPDLLKVPARIATAMCLRLLEGDDRLTRLCPPNLQQLLPQYREQLARGLPDEVDVVIADRRYQRCSELVADVVVCCKASPTSWTGRVDRLLLHRWLGVPLFLMVMYLLFVVTMGLGGVFQDFFDWGSESLLVMGLTHWLQLQHAPDWMIWLLPQGIGRGLNTVFGFIPVLMVLFFSLSVLDQSGYMARAALVVDRLMRHLGLSGKSFVPMIVGFGCNVPAILSARSLSRPKQRMITMLMTPFMSCGARLAIFAVFTATFFQHQGPIVIFALYMVGVLMALLTGWILHRTLLHGESESFAMELPPYRLPDMRRVLRTSWWRLRRFLWRAIKVVVPVCMVLSMMVHFNWMGQRVHQTHESVMGQWGQSMTTVFAPMGIQQDNWPATVALVSGFMAKEVVIGTLNSLYDQLHQHRLRDETHQAMPIAPWIVQWHAAVHSIPDHLMRLPHVVWHPLSATSSMQQMDPGSTKEMVQRFGGSIPAFAYMLFVLLYFPCVSTVAAMSREMHPSWAVFSVVWSLVIAYMVAVLFYQSATFFSHPWQSISWWCAAIAIAIMLLWCLKWVSKQRAMRSEVFVC